MSTISSIPASVPVKAPEVSAPKAPEVKIDRKADEADAPQPTVLAPLPPGQGPRIDQLV
jgi:hypothetical protein